PYFALLRRPGPSRIAIAFYLLRRTFHDPRNRSVNQSDAPGPAGARPGRSGSVGPVCSALRSQNLQLVPILEAPGSGCRRCDTAGPAETCAKDAIVHV